MSTQVTRLIHHPIRDVCPEYSRLGTPGPTVRLSIKATRRKRLHFLLKLHKAFHVFCEHHCVAIELQLMRNHTEVNAPLLRKRLDMFNLPQRGATGGDASEATRAIFNRRLKSCNDDVFLERNRFSGFSSNKNKFLCSYFHPPFKQSLFVTCGNSFWLSQIFLNTDKTQNKALCTHCVSFTGRVFVCHHDDLALPRAQHDVPAWVCFITCTTSR